MADLRFELAQALWDGDTDRGRALELAREAGKLYEEHAPKSEVAAEIRAWLGDPARQVRDP